MISAKKLIVNLVKIVLVVFFFCSNSYSYLFAQKFGIFNGTYENADKYEYMSFYLEDSISIDFSKFKNLKRITIRSSEVDIPDNVCECKKLEFVRLEGAGINNIPKCIFNLNNLNGLKLFKCNLEKVPKQLFSAAKIEKVIFEDCSIPNIQKDICRIGELKELKKLRITKTKEFTKIPEELFKLKNIQSLDFSRTAIKEIPPEISKLSNLICLDITGCPIKKLPKEITKLPNLKCLSILFTKLRKNEIKRLKKKMPNCEID